jgi:hypothetical protein
MIRFEFTLDDVDAENLISILNDERVRALEKALDSDWYKAHAAYLEDLKQKVLAGNTRVG